MHPIISLCHSLCLRLTWQSVVSWEINISTITANASKRIDLLRVLKFKA